MNVAIEISDDISRVLGGQAGDVSRAQVLGLGSRWETESFLRRAQAYHNYTMDDLERDIAAIRGASQ